MDLRHKKIRQSNRDITLLLIPVVAVLAKLIQLNFLPAKYFFDSWRMVSMLTGNGTMEAWTGYQDTVDFHEAINILNLTDVTQFSIFYGIVMTPVIMIIISRTKEMGMREVLFALMATGVLNIYVFNISKEMIQILYFLAIYLIISLPINNTVVKMLACIAVYYLESISFRSYYIIMAAMTVLMYFIFLWVKKRENIKKKHIIFAVIVSFIGVFIFFYSSQFVAYEDYIEALNVRDGSTGTIKAQGGANSAIYNVVEVNSNLGLFMFNYVINAVRMMVPIELLFKSPGYAPFFIYQIFILLYLFQTIKNIKKIDDSMIVTLSCFVAYFWGSVVFEPDFGSWVRHEATTFPILQLMAFRSNVYDEKINNRVEERVVIYETENV